MSLKRQGPAIGWRDLAGAGAAIAATMTVVLGTYFYWRRAGTVPQRATVAALMAAVAWAAMACPIIAAGGRSALAAVIRGGAVADGALLALLTMWATGAALSLLSCLKIYCTFAALALAGLAVTRLARAAVARHALAAGASVAMFAALSSPFWTGGLLLAAEGLARRKLAAAVIYANPFYSITSANAQHAQFVWHQDAPLMYNRISFFHDYVPAPACPWYAATAVYGGLAIALAAVGLLLWRTRR